MASEGLERTLEYTGFDQPENKRYDQGLYECEVWSDGSEIDIRADLTGLEGSREWKNCDKNPDHTQFIPVTDFGLEHLPQEYRTREILELVQAEADLTVRIRVQHTSANRPDDYPFAKFRGRDVSHTGTGVVTTVCVEDDNYLLESDSDDSGDDKVCSSEEDDGKDEETRRREFEAYIEESRKPAFSLENCPCFDCEDARLYRAKQQEEVANKNMCEGEISSGDNCEGQKKSFVEKGNCPTSPHQDLTQTESHKESNPGPTEKPQDRPCWLVLVETSLHVVYDTTEARNTLVDVFHDTNSAPARSQTLYGFRVEKRYEEEDKCIFECATHNEDLVRRLSASRAKKYLLSKTLGVPMLTQGDKTNPKSNSEHSESTPASSDKDGTNSAPDANRLAIIIGHPHGRSKTITVGQWSQRVKTLDTKAACITHYIYDTATCKGNSGGAVMTFSKTDVERATVAIYNHRHKSATTTPGLNMSSPSYEYTRDVFQHDKK